MTPLRIHYFQHIPFEGPGYIATWCAQKGHDLEVTKLFESQQFPRINNFDWLIIMGGPMGVYEHENYPWLNTEIEFIRQAIDAGKTVLGICLGAQLIASALGARVYPNAKKEIGWFPLSKTEAGKKNSLLEKLPDCFTAFHWHGDTFDLPEGSIHLLKTNICSNQAFLYRKNVLGLQLHLESTPQSVMAMVENCGSEIVPEDFIQSLPQILNEHVHYGECNKYLATILDELSNL